MGVSDNQTALAQLIASHQSGDMQLSEPLFTTFTDVDMQNKIGMHMYHEHTWPISIRNLLATSLDYGWYGFGDITMGLLPDTWDCGLPMRRKCRERFPRHFGSAIPTCITARAWEKRLHIVHLSGNVLYENTSDQAVSTFMIHVRMWTKW